MMLTFDDDLGARHFEFCFVGFVLGGSMQDKKGLQILRTEVAIFEKLEAISEPMPCGKTLVNGEAKRQLLNGDTSKQLHLTSPEFDLLYHYVAAVPWQTGGAGRAALDTIDWLERALHGAAPKPARVN
jgi:hypothetical protein